MKTKVKMIHRQRLSERIPFRGIQQSVLQGNEPAEHGRNDRARAQARVTKCEFSLFGFTFLTAPIPTVDFVTQADFAAIYSDSVFTFLYTGNRVYLQLPLNRIPAGVAPEGFSAADAQAAAVERTEIHNGVGHIFGKPGILAA